MKTLRLIDVRASINTGEIEVIERAVTVAESMLSRKPYRGIDDGRYILESDKDKFFAEDNTLNTPDAPVVEETPVDTGIGIPQEGDALVEENSDDLVEEVTTLEVNGDDLVNAEDETVGSVDETLADLDAPETDAANTDTSDVLEGNEEAAPLVNQAGEEIAGSEEVPTETTPEATPVDFSGDETPDAPTPKKRGGRPPGSKNKKK